MRQEHKGKAEGGREGEWATGAGKRGDGREVPRAGAQQDSGGRKAGAGTK